MLLVAPVVQLVGLGYAANMEFEHAATVIVDQDQSPESRAFCRAFAADKTFVVRNVETADEAETALREGAAQVALVVPQAFGRELVAGHTTTMQVLIDGSDPTRGVQAGGGDREFYSPAGGARPVTMAHRRDRREFASARRVRAPAPLQPEARKPHDDTLNQ